MTFYLALIPNKAEDLQIMQKLRFYLSKKSLLQEKNTRERGRLEETGRVCLHKGERLPYIDLRKNLAGCSLGPIATRFDLLQKKSKLAVYYRHNKTRTEIFRRHNQTKLHKEAFIKQTILIDKENLIPIT